MIAFEIAVAKKSQQPFSLYNIGLVVFFATNSCRWLRNFTWVLHDFRLQSEGTRTIVFDWFVKSC